MRAWPMLAILGLVLSGCTKAPEPAPANATAPAPTPAPAVRAAPPIDASAIPSVIRVLAASGGQTAETAASLEKWINERFPPKKVSVVVIATPEDALIRDLLAGKGDVAANLLLTFERDDQVAFAKPLMTGISEVIVTGPKEHPLVSLEDIGGRRIHVRKRSDHFASLTRLNDQLKKINRPPALLVIAAATQTDEDLIEQVRTGKIPATIAYDVGDQPCCGKLLGVHVNREVRVSQDGSLSWVTRKDTPQLLAVLNQFVDYVHQFVS
jgi:membrane-bound lytic murein transglycosylase MltF